MTQKTPLRWAAFWLALTGILLVLLLFMNYHRQMAMPADMQDLGFVAIREPSVIEPFSLVDQGGEPAGRDLLLQDWSLVFFGFTYCPDVCPTTLSILNQVVTELGDDAPQAILVSADPARDTPQRMKSYVKAFNPAFIGLTGDLEVLTELGYQMRVSFWKTDENEDYMIEHSANIALIDPKGTFVGYFTIPHRSENMVKVLQRVKQLPGSQ